MSIADEIEKLNNHRKNGAITEDEYLKAKKSLLARLESPGEKFGKVVGGLSSNANIWSILIHLSQFCGYLVPLAGLIVPVVLWQVKKGESEIIDKHGRIVANWIITECILVVIFLILCLAIIGIPLLMALGIVGVIFPIIGAIKANNGEAWPYPLSIRFFRIS